ncbi:DNA-3-methyladenine glycosylase II [Nocardia tenerifensis]|uniref:DNA-3-methyladenine glycosylase II n=1 Tax=Nocardia tenerifensis TaxID=228006 RepID=A0A318KAV2_9NOCA|nr:hypothetical protein [Nocardia tenerifensis]PXX53965.1 DNA-3-methyladenine glycosylase II [Nocardia tenerifensis]
MTCTIMTDHLGWQRTEDRVVYRALPSGDDAVLFTLAFPAAGDGARDLQIHPGGEKSRTRCATVIPSCALAGPEDLVAPLRAAGTVIRVANPSLWDALATAIMRQVIQAGHARDRYIRFCTAYGQPASRDGLTAWLFPSPERILALSDNDFRRVGAAFPMPALRAAARAYLDHGEKWNETDAVDLVPLLQRVPRIGPWTAKAALADHTGDFALYPYTDLAVQTWARALNPDRKWPESPSAFKTAWEQIAGDHLSTWTLLTLAWGISHGKPARSTS